MLYRRTVSVCVRQISLALGFWALAAGSSHAALFEDAEARRAIIELRERVSENQTAVQQLGKQSATGASLLELSNQNAALKREIAQLRGANEELARAMDALNQRLNLIDEGFSARLSKLEPVTLIVDDVEVIAQPAERQRYDDAIAVLRTGDYAGAQRKLEGFLAAFPESGYKPSVLFWLGNAQYAAQSFKGAQESFKTLIEGFSLHTRVPEAKLALANCQLELKNPKGAKATLQELVQSAPDSEAAQAALQRLQVLR